MKYTLQTLRYVLKNFIYLIPFAIIPAMLLSFSTDEEAIVHVLQAIGKGNLREWDFSMLFRAVSVLNFHPWHSGVFGIFGVILSVPCVSLMMALLEKHFRIGKRTFNGLWNKLNDNVLSTCGYVLFLLAIYEVWALFAAAILFFLSRITISVLAFVLCGVAFVALHVLLLYAISAIYLWLPCMQITGFPAFEALHYSYQLNLRVKWLILFAQLIMVFLSETIICICAVFLPNFFVFTLVTCLLYALMFLIYCVRMQIVYFDCDNIERADLTRYY